MRVTIPKFETKSELFSYLKENKSKLIAEKKSMPIYADTSFISVSKVLPKSDTVNKAKETLAIEEDNGVIRVKVVANTSNFIDSHSDMLIADCWTKSIQERKSTIPHLHDHIHQIGAKVGEVVDIYGTTLSFSELGIEGEGNTQSLIFITDVMKSYNEQVYNQYKLGKINQHSIGLQYVKIDLALNDETSEKEYEFWKKYLDLAINKEVAENQGYFWVVQEIKLLENSAVLFGSNPITPTLENNVKIEDTQSKKPNEITSTNEPENQKKQFIINYLK